MLNSQVSPLVSHSCIRNSDTQFWDNNPFEILSLVWTQVDSVLSNINFSPEQIEDTLNNLPDFVVWGDWFISTSELDKFKFTWMLNSFVSLKQYIHSWTTKLKESSKTEAEILAILDEYYIEFKQLLDELAESLKILKDIERLYSLWIWWYSWMLERIKNRVSTIKWKTILYEKDILTYLNVLNGKAINTFLGNKSFDVNWWTNVLESLFIESNILHSEIENKVKTLIDVNNDDLGNPTSAKELTYNDCFSVYWFVPSNIFNKVSLQLNKIIKTAGNWTNSVEKEMILKKKCYLFITEISELFKNSQSINEEITHRKIFSIYTKLFLNRSEYSLFEPIVKLFFEDSKHKTFKSKQKVVEKKPSFFKKSVSFIKQITWKLFGWWRVNWPEAAFSTN